MRRRSFTIITAVAALAIAACGGDDDTTEPPTDADAAPATAAAESEPSPAAQHFDSDFAQVCRGTGVDWATAYDPAVAGPHKVVVLQGASPNDLIGLSTGNPEWDVLFDADSDAYAAVELVACAIRTGEELAQTCTGYEDDDGNDTGNTVEYYSATYSVTLRAATTAEIIDEGTVEAEGDVCPMLVYFDDGETTTTDYANADVNDFLLPHATT